jgi:hypothetical protein
MKHSKDNCHSSNIFLVNEGLQCGNCGSVEYSDGTQGPTSWNDVPKPAPKPVNTTCYVTMTDRFMSGWGEAANKINKLVLTCDNWDEAEIVADNARRRTDQKNINICGNKPYYNPARYYVSWHDKTDYGTWYKKDHCWHCG